MTRLSELSASFYKKQGTTKNHAFSTKNYFLEIVPQKSFKIDFFIKIVQSEVFVEYFFNKT